MMTCVLSENKNIAKKPWLLLQFTYNKYKSIIFSDVTNVFGTETKTVSKAIWPKRNTCSMCRYLAKYKEWTLMKIVITIVGQDRVGIIAMVSNILAEKNVNILNINQNIVDGFFNMVMIADMTTGKISLKDLQQLLRAKGEEINLDIKVQHEDIFQIMHRI